MANIISDYFFDLMYQCVNNNQKLPAGPRILVIKNNYFPHLEIGKLSKKVKTCFIYFMVRYRSKASFSKRLWFLSLPEGKFTSNKDENQTILLNQDLCLKM